MRWEYKSVSWGWRGDWERLGEHLTSKYGDAGWEVISIIPNNHDVKVVMKRQAPTVHGEDAYR